MPKPTSADPSPATHGETSRRCSGEHQPRRRGSEQRAGAQHAAAPIALSTSSKASRRSASPAPSPTAQIRPSTRSRRITPWTKTGRNVVRPIIVTPDNSEAALAAAIVRRPQSFSEIIGSGERRSCTTKSADGDDRDQCRCPRSLAPPAEDIAGQFGHDGGDREREYAGAQVIDAAAPRARPSRGGCAQMPRGGDADRQVDPKDPGPGEVLDDQPAGERPEDRRQRPDAGEIALHAAALVRGIEVADDRHPGRLDRSGAHALNEPEHRSATASTKRSRRAPSRPETPRGPRASPSCGRCDRRACRTPRSSPSG